MRSQRHTECAGTPAQWRRCGRRLQHCGFEHHSEIHPHRTASEFPHPRRLDCAHHGYFPLTQNLKRVKCVNGKQHNWNGAGQRSPPKSYRNRIRTVTNRIRGLRDATTLGERAERFLTEHAEAKRKPKTAAHYGHPGKACAAGAWQPKRQKKSRLLFKLRAQPAFSCSSAKPSAAARCPRRAKLAKLHELDGPPVLRQVDARTARIPLRTHVVHRI